MLDTVKVEDWVALNVRGLYKLERVTRVSDVLVVTERYKFTKSSILWPSKVSSITARPALQHKVEEW